MAAANSEYPSASTWVGRAIRRLADGRRLIAGASAVLFVLILSTVVAPVAALVILAALALLIAALPPASPHGAEAPAVIAPAADADPGVRHLADALPDPCFILDRRGVVRHANQRAMGAFQIKVGEGLTFRLRLPDVVAAFESVARGGPPVRVEFGERVPTERWFAAWFARLEGTDLIALVIDDLSERRNADRVRVDFVANASHELRTPLASLAGFIETLQGPARDDVAAREKFLKIMQEQAERMSRLVNDLLSLSRVEMKQHLRPSDTVDLASVVAEVVAALEPLAADLGVTVETEFPKTPVEVKGDRDELIQVFENLIENACKYGQSGKRVVVGIDAGGGAPMVTVKDFGHGIPEEYIPRLTERFYRVDVEESRRHRGTGLGLAIAKHILARHQARMTVESRVGEGAAFSVSFPQARVADASGQAEKA